MVLASASLITKRMHIFNGQDYENMAEDRSREPSLYAVRRMWLLKPTCVDWELPDSAPNVYRCHSSIPAQRFLAAVV